jgi:superfamily I DNA/RNA helicase
MVPSSQQQAVTDTALTGANSINLIARAGCGKTTTLLAVTKALMEQASAAGRRVSIFIGAYNRSIAGEIKTKLSGLGVEDWKQVNGRWIAPVATASTIHSAGFRAWMKLYPDCKVEERNEAKLTDIIDSLAKAEPAKSALIDTMRSFAIKTVSLAKQRAFGVLSNIDDISKWFELVDHFGLEEELPEDFDLSKAIKFAKWVYRRSLESCQTIIDPDDMILAPLYHNARMFQYDWVLIDEAQDTNPARRALAKKMMKPGGRLIAVGDPAQAIYGFTGADSDSLDLIKAEFACVEMPLNVTYRCPKVVVRLANQWVPDLTAHESAPEGIYRSIALSNEDPKSKAASLLGSELKTLGPADAILCRNTKPLVALAYELIRSGVACQIEGRDIASGLIAIIGKWKAVRTEALAKSIRQWRDKEVQKHMAKGAEAKAESVNDKAETILVLIQGLNAEGKNKVEDLIAFIRQIFGDTKEGQKPAVLTLSTVHKSKGREWERVFLLGRGKYMPSKFARKDWQMTQERNLMYVAVTRAKNELVDVVVKD